MTTVETPTSTTQEQAEAFVTAQVEQERSQLEQAIARDSQLEQEVAKEHAKLEDAYWKLARKDLDAEPTEKEVEAQRAADVALRKLQGISQAISANKEKLSRLDGSYSRRVREKREQLDRGRNGGNGNDTNGGKVTTATAKRVPVPQKVIDRVVKDVQTKSQQEVADALNNEGVKTANGKDWTPQNIWHLVKKATGKGIPRKKTGGTTRAASKTTTAARKTAAAKPKTATARKNGAKPLSKKAQAAGTSRGGTGSRKKKTAAARRRSR